MTPQEAAAELLALRKQVSAKADMYAYLNEDTGKLKCALQPAGISATGTRLTAEADDWPELIAGIRAAWAEYSDTHRRETIRSMALEIIRATAEHGMCSDFTLRMKFSAEDVARYCADAIEDANEIASNGPFSVVTSTEKSNAA